MDPDIDKIYECVRKLDLVTEGYIKTPFIREQIVKEAMKLSMGEVSDATIAGIDFNADTQALVNICKELRSLLLEKNGKSNMFWGRKSTPNIIDDNRVLDSINRTFLGSIYFKIAAGTLAVGTTLFGVNLAVLTLDTTAITKTKTEAEKAANDAKAATEAALQTINLGIRDLKSKEAEAVIDARSELVKVGLDRLDIKGIEDRVAKSADDALRLNTEILFKPTKFSIDQIERQTQKSVIDITNINISLAEMHKKLEKSRSQAAEYDDLTHRLEDAVRKASSNAGDNAISGVVWQTIRNESLAWLASTAASCMALLIAAISVLGQNRLRRRLKM